MSPVFIRLLSTALLIAAALASPVFAQTPPPALQPPDGKWVHPPAEIPKVSRGDRTRNIDFLFGALKAAPDEESAKAVEGRIWALWAVSGSDTVDLLMMRAKAAADGKDFDLAVRLLGSVIELQPKYVEAWNRRATVYFLKHDYSDALADIREVLALEPRHFGALSGLGVILEEVGDEKHALEAFRRAQEVYPRLNGVADQVKTLKEKVEGRDI
jgi:tetratricopeptide (TPR) repeat protein